MAQLDRLKANLEGMDNIPSDALLTDILDNARLIILQEAYPYASISSTTALPERYYNLQINVAIELVNRRGMEGETTHSENGVTRTFSGADVSPALLRKIVPNVGVPS